MAITRQTSGAQQTSGPLPITDALRRVVVGFRVVSAVWMAILAVVAVISSDVLIGGAAALASLLLVWTAVTVVAYRRALLSHTLFVALDVLIAVSAVVWHAAVGVSGESFLGGYPFSAVVLVAAMRGFAPGLGAATALAAVSVAVAAAGGIGAQGTAATVLLYGIGAATVAWAAGVIRRHDERQRLVEQALADERSERARTQERAETGALLHDSVLQILALIQRRASDADEVVRLARGQERELRGWLENDRRDAGGSVAKQLEVVAADVEDLHGIDIDVVTVGDRPLDEAMSALVAAVREALVNAARHAGVDQVSVFVQADDDGITVFVRDRGSGFDPGKVESGRRGVSESIRGRMERHGGQATLKTAAGFGTEWQLHVGQAKAGS